MKNDNKNKGYTLIEILVASAIFVVVITVSLTLFAYNVNLQSRSKVLQESSQNAKFIIESIARDVRLADEFDITCYEETCNQISITNGEEVFNYFFEEENNKGNIYFKQNDSIVKLNTEDTNIEKMEFSGVDFENQTVQSFLKIKINFYTVKGTKKIDQNMQSVETTVSTRSYSKDGFGLQTLIK